MPHAAGTLTSSEARALPPKKCEREGCSVIFQPKQATFGRFCSISCGRSVVVRNYRKRKGYNSLIDEGFFTYWTPELSYTLGLIISDGHLGKSHMSTWCFSLTLKDRDLLVRLGSLWGEVEIRSCRVPKNPTHSQMYSIWVGNPIMCERLEELGVLANCKTYSQPFPEIPRDLVWHFLRGYTDGDGYVGSCRKGEPRVNWKSGSYHLLEGVRTLVNSSIGSSVSLVKDGGSFALHYGWGPARKILDRIYQDATIYMQRKFEIARDFLSPEVLNSVRPLEGTH